MRRPLIEQPSGGYSPWFVAVTALFITALLAANIISVKLIAVADLVLPAGIIVFPLSYIVGDVLTEVYGFRRARFVIWLGFFSNLLLVLAIGLTQILPAAAFWDGQAAYERILGFAPRLLVASFAAYLVGELANAFVLARLKIATRGRWLWTRTIGSTIIGQGLDSAIFVTIAFWGVPDLATIFLAQWIVKCLYEGAATPLTYLVVNFLKRREGLDTFDHDLRLSPFV